MPLRNCQHCHMYLTVEILSVEIFYLIGKVNAEITVLLIGNVISMTNSPRIRCRVLRTESKFLDCQNIHKKVDGMVQILKPPCDHIYGYMCVIYVYIILPEVFSIV